MLRTIKEENLFQDTKLDNSYSFCLCSMENNQVVIRLCDHP
jgi:hypothetical protein